MNVNEGGKIQVTKGKHTGYVWECPGDKMSKKDQCHRDGGSIICINKVKVNGPIWT